MNITILGSGSMGNASVVDNGQSSILIDIGFRNRNLVNRMKMRGLSPESIAAVFITHEHTDHIIGLEIFAKHNNVPVYVSMGTMSRLNGKTRKILADRLCCFLPGDEVQVNEFFVKSFPVLHDAADPVGYVICESDRKLCYATDMGRATECVQENMYDSNALVIESNHDTDMLWNGGYPEILKQRIAGPYGHLSNDAAYELLKKVMSPALNLVCLAHLSQENNRPETALRSVRDRLEEDYDSVPEIHVAGQDEPSQTFNI